MNEWLRWDGRKTTGGKEAEEQKDKVYIDAKNEERCDGREKDGASMKDAGE